MPPLRERVWRRLIVHVLDLFQALPPETEVVQLSVVHVGRSTTSEAAVNRTVRVCA